MKTRGRLLLIFLLAAIDSPATGQTESWVGEKILNKKPSKDIKFGDSIDGKEVYFPFSDRLPMIVRGERDGWLRIHDGHREGWVDKADFVLVRDAPAYFHRRVQASPNDTWALLMRGVGWLEKGEPDNAIKDFTECIRLDPKYSAAYNNRGTAWKDKKQYDRAIKDYNEAIRLDPTDASTYSNRGTVWGREKEYDKAIRDFDEASRLDPKHAYPFYNRACLYVLQGRADPAIENLQKSLELGYRNFKHMAEDSDLDSIRNDPRYKQLVEKYAK